MPDYKNLIKFCKKKNIILIEDAAESLGSSINKKKSGILIHEFRKKGKKKKNLEKEID